MSRIKTEFEYASNWRSYCNAGLRLMPFCTCNPMHGKAVTVHHVKYKRSFLRRILGMFLFHSPKKSVSGREIVGYDVFPLCENCHRNSYGKSSYPGSVHYTKVWRQLGGLNSHNVPSLAWSLRFKFWFLVIVLQLGRLLISLFRNAKK
ncbi:hypothetical protein [Nostoc sp. DedQUE07]|uniref:hypothetical protein n=1 Tax=Nostoc sp. DedQUE07 TaxID=3075392 RepID=UPI002AD5A79F|nr:hypothetical protein [Nostoc sp. DedQUE07]MDZ8131933.1 hypothetical protein [Nostoc sp. DedQUE07]